MAVSSVPALSEARPATLTPPPSITPLTQKVVLVSALVFAALMTYGFGSLAVGYLTSGKYLAYFLAASVTIGNINLIYHHARRFFTQREVIIPNEPIQHLPLTPAQLVWAHLKLHAQVSILGVSQSSNIQKMLDQMLSEANKSSDGRETVPALLALGARPPHDVLTSLLLYHDRFDAYARLIVQYGADINLPVDCASEREPNALLAAIRYHSLGDWISYLLNHPEVNVTTADRLGNTALHYVRDLTIVDRLIEKGAVLDAPNREGLTPIEYAAREGEIAKVQHLRKAHRVSIAQDRLTQLYGEALVTSHASQQRVEHLLAEGANINTQNCMGKTVLMLAAKYAQLDMVRMLLARGANPRLKDTENKTALDLSIEQSPDATELHDLLRSQPPG